MDGGLRRRGLLRQPGPPHRRGAGERAAARPRDGRRRGRACAARAAAQAQRIRVRNRAQGAPRGRTYRRDPARSRIPRRRDRGAAQGQSGLRVKIVPLTLLATSLLSPLAFAQEWQKELDTPYVPTPPAVVGRMLELAQVKPGETVIDLGS